MVAAVEDLLPRSNTHHQIVEIFNKLEILDSVCVQLQSEDRTVSDVMLLFDATIAKYPATTHHLSPSARIVHSPVFKGTVVKVLTDRTMNAEEEEAVARFDLSLLSQLRLPRRQTLLRKHCYRQKTTTRYRDQVRCPASAHPSHNQSMRGPLLAVQVRVEPSTL